MSFLPAILLILAVAVPPDFCGKVYGRIAEELQVIGYENPAPVSREYCGFIIERLPSPTYFQDELEQCSQACEQRCGEGNFGCTFECAWTSEANCEAQFYPNDLTPVCQVMTKGVIGQLRVELPEYFPSDSPENLNMLVNVTEDICQHHERSNK